jgi:riboflavin biosynthesis pyrimidine reductase
MVNMSGPVLAQSLTEAGLIDEYRLYLRPVVLCGSSVASTTPEKSAPSVNGNESGRTCCT